MSILVAMLRNPALMGYQVRREVLGVDQHGKKVYGKPEIVRGEDARPILRAQPILDPVTWAKLQERLDEMNEKRGPYKGTHALLLDVLKCGVPTRRVDRVATSPFARISPRDSWPTCCWAILGTWSDA